MRDHENRIDDAVIQAARLHRERIAAREHPGLRATPANPKPIRQTASLPEWPRAHRNAYRELLERYEEAVYAAGLELERHGYIDIYPAQLETLSRCGVKPDAIRLVELANGLCVPTEDFSLHDRMRLLASLPPAPTKPDEPLDWEAWWLQSEAWRKGVRPIGDLEQTSTLSPALDKNVIPALGATAARNAPAPERVIELIDQSARPFTSEYYVAIAGIINLAQGIQARPDEYPNYSRTPESVAAGLKRHPGYRDEHRDIRSLPGPHNWKQDAYNPATERIHSELGVIISRQAPFHLFSLLPAAVYGHADAPGPGYAPPVDDADTPDTIEAEDFYAYLVSPRWYAARGEWRAPDLPAAVAQRYRLTPNEVKHPTDSPNQPLRPCPLASQCSTHCGSLQRQGWQAFPLTADGQPDSCEAYRFQIQNRDLPATTRAALAEKMIRRIQDRKHPEAPAEVDTGGSQTDKAQPDANRQQSLF